MLSIGEFSQAARLTVKTLRYYHELGILIPAKVDAQTGYRFYDEDSWDRVAAIGMLKELGFSLNEIADILRRCSSEDELHRFIRSKLREVRGKVRELRAVEARLEAFEARLSDQPAAEADDRIVETDLTIAHAAVLPVNGRYEEIGRGFRRLYRMAGRYAVGSAYSLFYDMEHRDGDARMEAVVELSPDARITGVECRTLSYSGVVKTTYRGPYGGQGETYLKLFAFCREHNRAVVPPIIEHHIKGPGPILKGNPSRYITECMVVTGIRPAI